MAEPGPRPDVDDLDGLDDLARRSADAMLGDDLASAGLGMTLLDVGPGRARLRMPVRDDMVNGHAIVHGGLVFTLADSAFAVACNSHGVVTVAAGADITFTAPGRLGDVLLAEARETDVFGRSGVTDVRVTRESDGALIAVFRGRSRSLGRPIPGVAQGVQQEGS
ncbi:hydroxyphenylacetyl-CoA thioesterase PaaI [Angustibacter luteus]